jgi:hypothetical protein
MKSGEQLHADTLIPGCLMLLAGAMIIQGWGYVMRGNTAVISDAITDALK